jgi:hypothetical protein
MAKRATKAQRVRFWVVACSVYLALVVAAVLLHDRAPWTGAGVERWAARWSWPRCWAGGVATRPTPAGPSSPAWG